MRYVFMILVCYSLLVFPLEDLPADDQAWVHLSTFWDATGSIGEISPTGEYVIIENGQVKKLVHILTGEVILEVENGEILFSENNQYAIYFQRINTHPYVLNHHILNLNNRTFYTIDGIYDSIHSNEKYNVSYQRVEDAVNPIYHIYLIETGELVAEFLGSISTFNHDFSHVVLHSNGEVNHGARVINIEMGLDVAEYLYPIPEYVYSFSSMFNTDDSLLAIYFFPDEMQIIDTSTWEILYTLTGGIWFSPDGNYIAHNNHAGYSEVQLIEAHTGQVVDEFLGSLGFSPDGQYWIRAEAVSYDERDTQIIRLSTDEVIFQRLGYGVPSIDNDSIISIWDFSTQSTHFYNANTKELIREISGEVQRYDEFVIARDTYSPLTYLRDWDTDDIYAIGRQIKAIPNRNLVLVSNGVFVDLYGQVDTNTENMPPPRPSQGIALSNPEVITLYSAPNAENPRIIAENNTLNPTYYDVLGQTNNDEWLYVSFTVSGVNGGRFQGWIRNENLEIVVSWDNVPVVNAENPMQSLRTIALRE